MKSRLKNILFLTIFFLIATTSAFAKKTSKPSKSTTKIKIEEPITILFHDNCPKTTATLKEEVELRATIPEYKGIISVTYQIIPEEKHAYPIINYYNCCERIRAALEKSTNTKYLLSFNTKQDKTGTNVFLSDKTSATQSVILLLQQKETNVYAFYEEEFKTEEIKENKTN